MAVDKSRALSWVVFFFQPPAELPDNISCLSVCCCLVTVAVGMRHTFCPGCRVFCVLCSDVTRWASPDRFLISRGRSGSTLSPRIFLASRFLFCVGFAFHRLLVKSLLNNYTPAALISGTAISVGGPVISDNGGHFLRLSQLGVDDEPGSLGRSHVPPLMTHSLSD